MKPGSLSSTGSAPKQPFAAFFSIRNLQSLPYMFFGALVHKGGLLVPYSYRFFLWAQKTLEPQGFWGFHNRPMDCCRHQIFIRAKEIPNQMVGDLCSRYLSSRAVTRQVLAAYMSLTSVVGMGSERSAAGGG